MSRLTETTEAEVARLPQKITTGRNSGKFCCEEPLPLRLAIVGCGPRGAHILETISRRLSPFQFKDLHVTVYETASSHGAGRVYDPAQPHVLRMNFATQHIDFWKFDASVPTKRSGSLIGWLKRYHPSLARSDQYIPRAIVGEYLASCFQAVRSQFDPNQLKFQSQQVVDMHPAVELDGNFQSWNIRCSDGVESQFDEVVLTSGHEGLRAQQTSKARQNHRSIFPFPVNHQLSERSVPADSSVLIRGFGLTALDVVLALTQGRKRPCHITIMSRSGRPMLAKPTAAVEPIDATFWDDARMQLKNLRPRHGHLRFHRDIWPIIVTAASELLASAGFPTTTKNISDWYRGWQDTAWTTPLRLMRCGRLTVSPRPLCGKTSRTRSAKRGVSFIRSLLI